MTQISSGQLNLVKDPYQFLPLYAGSETAKQGIEVESFFVDKQRLQDASFRKACIATPAQTAAILDEASKVGLNLQREACGVIEYASDPYLRNLDGTKKLIAETTQNMQDIEKIASGMGLQRIPVNMLPNLTLNEAKKNLINSPRIYAMVKAVGKVYPEEALKLGLLTSSVQMSLSYETMEQGYKDTVRASFLSPLMAEAFSSFSGYSPENKKVMYNLRMTYYTDGYGKSGGFNPSVSRYTRNPDDFFKNHINEVMSQPLLYYYNKNGREIFPGKKKITPADLLKRNCLTESTFHLAESFMYHDVKICSLRDKEQKVTGKRIEIRAMDSGGFQPVALSLLTNAFLNPAYTSEGDKTFERCGLDISDPYRSSNIAKQIRYNAIFCRHYDEFNHDKRFVNAVSDHVKNVYSGTGLEEMAEQVCIFIEQPEMRDSRILSKLGKNRSDLMRNLSKIEQVGVQPLYKLI